MRNSTICIIGFLIGSLGAALIQEVRADSILVGGYSYHLGHERDDFNEEHQAAAYRFDGDYPLVLGWMNKNSYGDASVCAYWNPRSPNDYGFISAKVGVCNGYEVVFSHGFIPVIGAEVGIHLLSDIYIVGSFQLPNVLTLNLEYKF